MNPKIKALIDAGDAFKALYYSGVSFHGTSVIADFFAAIEAAKTVDDEAATDDGLRDELAARAMQGICAHQDNWGQGVDGIAVCSYQVAEAMMKARKP